MNQKLAWFLLLSLMVLVSPACAQTRGGGDLLKRFDKNGDGTIDEQERRGVREKLRDMRNKPGAMNPSGKTEVISGREVTELDYASSDGRKIPCVLSMPMGNGPFPMLVTIHGGQGDRDLGYLRTMAAPNPVSPTVTAFNQQPWGILAISYRSGNGALFGMEHDDVIAGIRFAKSLPKIDPNRVGVVGGSHGGHLTLVAAEKMGREFLCAAALSPWMTDPLVYMTGNPQQPPLSLVPAPARDDLQKNGRAMFNGLQRGRGMSEAQAREFLAENSIEANADRIEVPLLFITSRGDDQAPHVLIEPMIKRMQAAQKEVEVYTAEKSPHGFYWARTVSAARSLRGEKSKVEEQEEAVARQTIIDFFAKHFAGRQTAVNDPEQPEKSSPKKTGPSCALMEASQCNAETADEEKTAAQPGAETSSPLPTKVSDEDRARRLQSAFNRLRGRGMPNAATRKATPKLSVPVAAKTAPLKISGGDIVGELREDVSIYRGIPYAAAPVGDLRWKAPQPPASWPGIRDATQFGAASLQSEIFVPRNEQSEDCLSLNIWKPNDTKPDSKLPVLFWIHGGAFIQSSGAQRRYDGTELARHGVVVITINYRLGPLGLFSHPSLTRAAAANEPLGNYCLLDMLAALRWTKQNIAAFGGDPGNVTISGSSAGGTSCLFLMGIPEAEGLFHKAIIHSSGGIRNIQTLAEAEQAGVRLGQHWGLDASASPTELRSIQAELAAVSTSVIRQLDLPVKPLVDGRLVTGVPADVIAVGKQMRIPVIMGAANGESGARGFGDTVAKGGAFGFQMQLANDMVRAGQQVYLFQLTYVPPEARSSRSAAQHGESVAYAFGTIGLSTSQLFGFQNELTAAAAMQKRRGGGREDDSQGAEDSAQGRELSKAMMEYWVAFMREGQPAARGLQPWPTWSEENGKVMVFGNQGVSVSQ